MEQLCFAIFFFKDQDCKDDEECKVVLLLSRSVPPSAAKRADLSVKSAG